MLFRTPKDISISPCAQDWVPVCSALLLPIPEPHDSPSSSAPLSSRLIPCRGLAFVVRTSAAGSEKVPGFCPFNGKRFALFRASEEEILMPSLALSMIVKNAEQDLPLCLASARPLVDQIVIVDTGSTDRTCEIAREFDATLLTIPWPD